MKLTEDIANILFEKHLTVSTAESCTGGLLSSRFTDISGSSEFVTLNLVTYSNQAKERLLGVKKETLEQFGAVSEECAYEMAKGLYNLTESDICISTTGIAGPTGGSSQKPVGLMFSTIFTPQKYKTYKIQLNPSIERKQMKALFCDEVLKNLIEFLS